MPVRSGLSLTVRLRGVRSHLLVEGTRWTLAVAMPGRSCLPAASHGGAKPRRGKWRAGAQSRRHLEGRAAGGTGGSLACFSSPWVASVLSSESPPRRCSPWLLSGLACVWPALLALILSSKIQKALTASVLHVPLGNQILRYVRPFPVFILNIYMLALCEATAHLTVVLMLSVV